MDERPEDDVNNVSVSRMRNTPNQEGPWSRGDICLFGRVVDIVRCRYSIDVGTEEKEVSENVRDLV
jgi:hypothetical protein